MISVCMATYNGENFLHAQLTSIIHQLGPNDEICISDDSSTDATLSIAMSLKDERVKVIQNQRRLGYTKNFERALASSSGEFVFLADQDDIWLPDRVSETMEHMAHHDMVVCNGNLVDEDLKPLGQTTFEVRDSKNGFWANFYRVRHLGCAMAFNRNLLDSALPFPKNSSLITHDAWLAAVGEGFFKVALIERPCFLYRRHSHNASMGGLDEGNSLFLKLSIRAYTLAMLARRSIRISKRALTR